MNTELWAEISTISGESALLIMERPERDERPEVINEVAIAIDPDMDVAHADVAAPLAALGYREIGERREYTEYGCALNIEAN